MPSYRARFTMMGTVIDLVVHHHDGQRLIKDCYLQLQDFEQRFTVNQTNSELMRVNHNAGIRPVRVKSDLYELIKKAKTVSQDRVNPFNVAIGPLVKSWRIGFKDAKFPSSTQISAQLKRVDPRNMILDDLYQTVYLAQIGMEIDLGAIAKGYFADRLKEYLLSQGVEQGIINLGGNVLTIGSSNLNRAWNVGIQNPLSTRGEVSRVVALSDASMVTSGVNERYFELNGKRYHHLLDGQSGYPITTDIASVTIISKHSVEGEIWSTAGFLASMDNALGYLNQQQGIEAVLISQHGEVYVTEGLSDDGRNITQLKPFGGG
ncbi:FAD:protein FMN transferase [Vibrio rarus]|uniref:FAD:protein FMN transferase n=1 Tax=Vibrio rarus TaxID=413403 RepID=UPI0021C34533|nr:FAD:protein FMN transferase [Vibrio rarus]